MMKKLQSMPHQSDILKRSSIKFANVMSNRYRLIHVICNTDLTSQTSLLFNVLIITCVIVPLLKFLNVVLVEIFYCIFHDEGHTDQPWSCNERVFCRWWPVVHLSTLMMSSLSLTHAEFLYGTAR